MVARAKNKPFRRTASASDLLKKPARTAEYVIKSLGDDGSEIELVLKLKAIGAKHWDDLVAQCPPTAEQRKDNALYDPNALSPKLIAACAVEPPLTEEEAEELFASDSWSNYETQQLFLTAARLCNTDFNVPFTEGDSEGTPTSS